MKTDPGLEALSNKVRHGEPIGFLEAIAVIDYQEHLRKERERAKKAKSLLGKLKEWWLKRGKT